MKTIHLSIQVDVPDNTNPKRVQKLTDTLLDIGLADAAETLHNGEGNLKDAKAAVGWNFHSPQIIAEHDGRGADLYLVHNENNDEKRASCHGAGKTSQEGRGENQPF